jgi:DNA polymerase elongation subunit (family B)
MRTDIFNLEILRLLSKYWKKRVIALDIETHITKDFLEDEFILGISCAVRNSGKITSSSGIDTITFSLEEESEEAESKLMYEVNSWLNVSKPLGVIGYQSRAYDIPLLIRKNQKYQRRREKPLWALIDTLQEAAHVDLYFLLRTLYKVKNMREVLEVPEFRKLPLRKEKDLVSKDWVQKGEDILNLWQNQPALFKRYIEGDAINPLLIAEHLIMTQYPDEMS